MNILIGLVEHMGDIVACEPVVRYLKAINPGCTITWVVSSRYRELIDANPDIDKTIAVDCVTDWIKLVKHNPYDQVVDLHVNYRVCEQCRVPLIKTAGNPFISVYEYFDYGSLLEAFSAGAGLPKLTNQPRVYIRPEHRSAVDALNLPKDFCVVHRSSNNAAKDWTDEKWAQLVTFVRDKLQIPVVDVGAGKLVTPIAVRDGVIDLFNRIPILQTAEVIARARFFIGVDSGPAHLANAVQTPGVVMLGRLGPYRKYMPYTGFYASASPFVKIVRNLLGEVRDLTEEEVQEAVRYVAEVSRTFDRGKLAQAQTEPALSDVERASALEKRATVEASGLFDADWYVKRYPDNFGDKRPPLDHFLLVGWKQKRSPSPKFDTEWYLDTYKDIAKAGLNPLVHYIEFGQNEGRAPMGPGAGGGTSDQLAQTNAATWGRVALDDPAANVHLDGAADLGKTRTLPARQYPRTFAFYLPQFHPIAENDWAHGRGFSEWHNVIKAKPLFRDHYQPRVPGELGFYDLRSIEVIERQAALAKEHGIDGFCFYYYYFHGKKLLFDPIKKFIESKIDMPFMFLWANENWSKAWDGGDREVIIAQQHSTEDDLVFLRELAPIFADPRYTKVAGKPMLLIYKAHLLVNARETTELWRQEIEKLGFPGIYLVMVDDWGTPLDHPRDYGFDASYEIPSNIVTEQVMYSDAGRLGLTEGFTGRIVDYAKFAHYHLGRAFPSYKRFRTVMLPWDNTARYGARAMVQVNNQGDDYKQWLLQALLDTYDRYEPDERIVFLHSWNEWCEGTYLEPDGKFGRYYLEQTRDAIDIATRAINLARDPAQAPVVAELFQNAREKQASGFYSLYAFRMQNAYLWGDLHRQREAAHEMSRKARAEAEARLIALQRSMSWRITAPLRKLVSILRSR